MTTLSSAQVTTAYPYSQTYPWNFSIQKVTLYGSDHQPLLPTDSIQKMIAQWNQKSSYPFSEGFTGYFLPYTLKGYSATVTTVSRQENIVTKTSTRINFIFYLFRELPSSSNSLSPATHEMFALCHGKIAHMVLDGFRDFLFPIKIAKKLLNPKSIKKYKSRSLGTDEKSSSETFLPINAKAQENLLSRQITLSFLASFKNPSSIYALKLSETPIFQKDRVMVQWSQGKVKIEGEYTFDAWIQIVGHFSQIDQNLPTQKILKNENRFILEKTGCGFRFLDGTIPVPYSDYPSLDNELSHQILTHNQGILLKAGKKFVLKYQEKEETFYHPTLPEIFEAMKKQLGPSQILDSSTLKQFSFQSSDLKTKEFFPLTRFIEGKIIFHDQCFYRLKNHWYRIELSDSCVVARSFYHIIKTRCIKPNEPGFLAKPWPKKKNQESEKKRMNLEGDYNQGYFSEPGYLVGDCKFQKGEKIELFDILYYGFEGQLFLYHVKDKLGQSTRDACSQIRNAANQLFSFRNGSPSIFLNQFYQTANAEKEIIPMNEAEFVSLFKTRKIVFVYAFNHVLNDNPRIENDPNPGSPIKEAELGKTFGEKTSQVIMRALKAKKYLDAYDCLTDHFFNTNQAIFAEELFKESRLTKTNGKNLYHILHKNTSPFTSRIAHEEILLTVKAVEDHGFEFKILQLTTD